MALRNSFITALLFLITPFAWSKIVLPELLTKQAVNNIKFLSADGKFTYYQKRSGTLLFSTNYKVNEILKSEIGTDYNIYATKSRKKLAVTQNTVFHNYYSLRSKLKIYTINYGESFANFIGEGISPRLHNNDTWISYFDPYTKIIYFENTFNSALKFQIKINNKANPYFIPTVLMSDDNSIYYTDLGEGGIPGLLSYKRNTSKSEVIFKAESPLIKIDVCLNNDKFILFQQGIRFSKAGSSAYSIKLPFEDFSKKENIYKSNENDLGQLSCDFSNDSFAFLKNVGTTLAPKFDIAEFHHDTKKIEYLTETKTNFNIINMDGTLLTEDRGKYFIVKGDGDYKNVDLLKAKIDGPVLSPTSEKSSIDKEDADE